jgi:hypothetical protein
MFRGDSLRLLDSRKCHRSQFSFEIMIFGQRGSEQISSSLVFVDLAARYSKQSQDGKHIRKSLTALKTFLHNAANGERADYRSGKY